MPLHEYINDPVAHDIIHNGATFQVLAKFTSAFTFIIFLLTMVTFLSISLNFLTNRLQD